MNAMQVGIVKECKRIAEMLCDKNRKYGDSLLHPISIFHKGSAIEAVNARIDDKLARIQNAPSDEDEDPELDLIGYLIMKRVIKKILNASSGTPA